jgi:hypothetical protein
MHMPPRHLAAVGGRQRPSTAPSPISPTPVGPTAMRPRQTFKGRRQLRQSIGSGVPREFDREDDCASRSGQPSPDGSLEARKRQGSVGLLSAPSSQPSLRVSLLGSRSGAQLHPPKSAALSDPGFIHGIPVQAQAAAEVGESKRRRAASEFGVRSWWPVRSEASLSSIIHPIPLPSSSGPSYILSSPS